MPDDGMDHTAMGHHMGHDTDRKKAASNPHEGMMGMASPEQMAELAASEATAFDKLFLELMIAHHEGAVDMVDDLLDQPGSAYDPILYEFVGDIKNDQRVEIERMHALLVTCQKIQELIYHPDFMMLVLRLRT